MSETKSFESIANAARKKVYSNYNIAAIEVAGMIGTLSAAHYREIRDAAQQEYDRGFNDGQHSMDAEHRAVAMRLRGLRFDGGSHENLSRIAYAIYPCATGWTCESAAGLRDKLVDLMGGVSDDTCCRAGGGACDADDCDCAGEQEVSDGRVADDCGADTRGGGCGGDLHMAGVTYDVMNSYEQRIEKLVEQRDEARAKLDAIRDALDG